MQNVFPLNQQPTKPIQPSTLKHGQPIDLQNDKIKLERVIGLTVSTNSSLDVDPTSGIIAYPAGCTIVFHNPTSSTETHLSNICRKSITCLKFSSDGRYLATGECGHQSFVRVWDMTDFSQKAEFSGHKYGINCVAFSPNQKYLVSVGSPHDMIINVWDWKSNLKYASNKVSAKIKAIAFFSNGNFITIGNRHVKFWYLQTSRSISYKEPIPLMGRSAILGELRNNDFVDVCCGSGVLKDYSYAITKSGILCEFNSRRLLDRWIELKTTCANCMVIGNQFIFVGCSEGIVRCFIPGTLQYVTTLPRTHYLGVDIANVHDISHMTMKVPSNAKYPDAIALAYDEINMKLTCVYNDHSLYVWDIKNIKKIGKSNSFLFHSACIWGVELYPTLDNDSLMPKNSFITCSSDCTIRIWNLHSTNLDEKYIYQNNIYSNELLKIIYIDPELNFIKNTELNLVDKNGSSTYDSKNGVRAIRISPDGLHLASGDRSGKIRVHDFKTLREICLIEAHNAEILYLDYSNYSDKYKLFASASRDRLIHVFNVDKGYNFTQTLDDHSSSITAVRFINSDNKLQMVSCGADKSIIFRNYNELPDKSHCFVHNHYISGKTTFYDMEIDLKQKHIMTACQDRNIRIYNTASGKHSRTFKGSVSDDGSLIKVVLDKSGIFLATSCTDKTLCVYDFTNGQCLATMYGHSELVTGLKFTNDSRYLISASGDGCIFIWKMPSEMIKYAYSNKNQITDRTTPIETIENENLSYEHHIIEDDISTFNIPTHGELPLWAKNDNCSPKSLLNVFNNNINIPKGIWAERATNSSEHSSIFHLPINQDEFDCIKDESADSGTETSRSIYPENLNESLIIPNKMLRIPPVFVSNNFDDNVVVNLTSEKENSISDIQRVRNLTDDSSLGSFKNEEIGSNDDDVGNSENGWKNYGNIKNPVPYTSNTGENDFTIMKLNINVPQKSLRKSKIINKKDHLLSAGLTELSSHSMSDSDDETLSMDNSDKNSTMLSTSNERLDMIQKREEFLKNTFESLGEPEQDEIKNNITSNTSISSQYKGNQQLSSTIQPNTNIESQNKRIELQHRIEETRKTLQNLGSHSNLKSSQSIYDLSKNYGKFTSKLPVRNQLSVEKQSNKTNNIRRVCSLIDLSNSKSNNDNKLQSEFYGNKNCSKNISRKSVNSNIHKSSSVMRLDRSDSESDFSHSASEESIKTNKVVKQTIVSQNKTIMNNSNLLRRKMMNSSQSTNALNVIGQNEEDSSSEEFFTSLHNNLNQTYPSRTNIRMNKSRQNSSSLTRSVSEINLKSPSSKPFEKSRNRNNDFTNSSGTLGHQKHLKSYLSILTDQLLQTTDKILEHTNCVNVNRTHLTKRDRNELIHKLEQIVDGGFIFSHQNSRQALNKTQQYLDVLIDLIKKRLTLDDM